MFEGRLDKSVQIVFFDCFTAAEMFRQGIELAGGIEFIWEGSLPGIIDDANIEAISDNQVDQLYLYKYPDGEILGSKDHLNSFEQSSIQDLLKDLKNQQE